MSRSRAPTVQGNRPHLLLTADLTDLLPTEQLTDPAALADRIAAGATTHDLHPGDEGGAQPGGPAASAGEGPRLRWTGPLPIHRARHLAQHAKLTAVLTLGPYRIVNVGRTHRTLPAWLRGILQLRDRHCRGPDCDRPAAWTEPHHQHAWDDGGDTDLNATIPPAQSPPQPRTSKRWHTAPTPTRHLHLHLDQPPPHHPHHPRVTDS